MSGGPARVATNPGTGKRAAILKVLAQSSSGIDEPESQPAAQSEMPPKGHLQQVQVYAETRMLMPAAGSRSATGSEMKTPSGDLDFHVDMMNNSHAKMG